MDQNVTAFITKVEEMNIELNLIRQQQNAVQGRQRYPRVDLDMGQFSGNELRGQLNFASTVRRIWVPGGHVDGAAFSVSGRIEVKLRGDRWVPLDVRRTLYLNPQNNEITLPWMWMSGIVRTDQRTPTGGYRSAAPRIVDLVKNALDAGCRYVAANATQLQAAPPVDTTVQEKYAAVFPLVREYKSKDRESQNLRANIRRYYEALQASVDRLVVLESTLADKWMEVEGGATPQAATA